MHKFYSNINSITTTMNSFPAILNLDKVATMKSVLSNSNKTRTVTITMNNGFYFNDSGLGLLHGEYGSSYTMDVITFQWTSMVVQTGSSSYDVGVRGEIIKYTTAHTDISTSININKDRTVVTITLNRTGSNSTVSNYRIMHGFIIAVPYLSKP